MAYGLNRAEVIGHLGHDPEIRTMQNGERVAALSVATDESYWDRNARETVKRTQWHRVVTFQKPLIELLDKHGSTGRKIFVSGKMWHRKWQDRDGNDRYTMEIIINQDGRMEFLDRPEDGAPASEPPAEAAAPMPSGPAPEIPF